MSGHSAARASLHVAEEYLEAATAASTAGQAHPAVSCAVLAGMHALDAICQRRLGERSHARSHAEALRLARTAGTEGRVAAAGYEKLLAEKSKAQYDTTPIGARTVTSALRRADSLVTLSRRVLAGS